MVISELKTIWDSYTYAVNSSRVKLTFENTCLFLNFSLHLIYEISHNFCKHYYPFCAIINLITKKKKKEGFILTCKKHSSTSLIRVKNGSIILKQMKPKRLTLVDRF